MWKDPLIQFVATVTETQTQVFSCSSFWCDWALKVLATRVLHHGLKETGAQHTKQQQKKKKRKQRPRYLLPRKDQRWQRIVVSQQPDILLISKSSKRHGGSGQNNKQNTLEMK